MDLDAVTELADDKIFTIYREPDRSYEKDFDTQFDFYIEMNMDIKEYNRSGYNILDFFSDIGGI